MSELRDLIAGLKGEGEGGAALGSPPLLEVYTYKEGLLSRVAHDLCIGCESFDLQLVEAGGTEPELRVLVDPRALKVRHAIKGGRPAPEALSAKDRAQINASIQSEVLKSTVFPDILFAARVSERWDKLSKLPGRLSLHGVERQVELVVERQGGRLRLELLLTQSQFGIAPFRALMGALKIKDELLVRFEADDPGHG